MKANKTRSNRKKAAHAKPLFMITSMQNCNSKRKYRNENEATRTAEVQMLADMNLELSVYKCDVCRHWHLTRVS